MKKIYEIDGNRFSNLDEFFDEVGRVLVPGIYWGKNLDAFNDILRGGFGTPDEGFIFRWKNSEVSRRNLGYPETVRLLRLALEKSYPTDRISAAKELQGAEESIGPTTFDWLIEIILDHCEGGEQAEDGVELELA